MYFQTIPRFEREIGRNKIYKKLWDAVERELKTKPTDWLLHKWKPYCNTSYRKYVDALHNLRIIGRIEWADIKGNREPVLYVLDIMERKTREYEQFLDDKKIYDANHWAAQRSNARQAFNAKLSSLQPISLPPAVDNMHLQRWLQSLPGWTQERYPIILESHSWQVDMEKFQPTMIAFVFEAIAQIVDGQDRHPYSSWKDVYISVQKDVGVLYTIVPLLNGLTGILLIKPYDSNSLMPEFSQISLCLEQALEHPWLLQAMSKACGQSELAQKIAALQNKPGFSPTDLHNLSDEEVYTLVDVVSSFVNRAYDAWVALDFKTWEMVRGSHQGVNLYLSDEETQILDQISRDSKQSLPVFISGGAGSGKTTMLIYLFAYYCTKALDAPEEPYPILLTYAAPLLNEIKLLVCHTLERHPRFQIEMSQENQMLLERNFDTFTHFLLSFLSQQEREEFFPDQGHISFSLFKAIYSEVGLNHIAQRNALRCCLGERKKWSPEFAWFIIRSIIQGVHEDRYIGPEEFREYSHLAGGVISEKVFEDFYATIWEKWYKNLLEHPISWEGEKKRYWDDQSLVRYLLRKSIDGKLEMRYFPVIFCDEAQDFTPIEFRLILQFFMFRHYRLAQRQIYCLPLAFAGDVNQTLYPTGFSFKALKALYFEEILGGDSFGRVFDNHQVSQFTPNDNRFPPLKINYRSSGPITRFLNMIQLYRRTILGQDDIEPQRPRNPLFGVRPVYIAYDSGDIDERLERLRDMVIIINCEEDEKREYVKNDPVLHTLFGTTDLDNIYTPFEAKGLSFPKVILWKFGDSMRNDGQDDAMSLRYFFNRLYVAASRAIEVLYALDTSQGVEKLWAWFIDVAKLLGQLPHNDQKKWDERHLLKIDKGLLDDLVQYNLAQMKKWAEDSLQSAIASLYPDNIQLAEKARAIYSRIISRFPSETDYCNYRIKLCNAWILRFRGEVFAAGEQFHQLSKFQEAFNCYWHTCAWQSLDDMRSNWPGYGMETRGAFYVEIIDYMNGRKNLQFGWELCRKETERIRQIGLRLSEERQILELLARFAEDTKKQVVNLDRDWLPSLGDFFTQQVAKHLTGAIVEPILTTAGLCYFYFGNWEAAVDCFEKANTTQLSEYIQAKDNRMWQQVKADGFPAGFKHLQPLNEFAANIITIWKQQNSPDEPEWYPWLSKAYQSLGDKGNAVVYLAKAQDFSDAYDLAKIIRTQDEGKYAASMRVLLGEVLQSQKYSHFVEICLDYLKTSKDSRSFAPWLAKQIADSDLRPRDFLPQRSQGEPAKPEANEDMPQEVLTKFLEENFTNELNSDASISLVEIAQNALEKIGRIQAALQFSRRFVNSRRNEVKQFARERYLLVLIRDQQYWEKRLEKLSLINNAETAEYPEKSDLAKINERVRAANSELARLSREWSIDIDAISAKKSSSVVGGQIISSEKPPADFITAVLEIDIENRTPNDVKELLTRHSRTIKHFFSVDISNSTPLEITNLAKDIQHKLRENILDYK